MATIAKGQTKSEVSTEIELEYENVLVIGFTEESR